MINANKQTSVSKGQLRKQRSYQEIVQYLDAHWDSKYIDAQKTGFKKVEAALQHPSQKFKTILVAGKNGKSLTINFIAQLLKEENLKVGTFYSPHFQTYNERLALNNETISNQQFEEVANAVLDTAEGLGIELHSRDILALAALHYFAHTQVDVAVLEVSMPVKLDPVATLSPKICAITRVNEEDAHVTVESAAETLAEYEDLFYKDAHIVSADQSKMNLQTMHQICDQRGAHWAMPIRKLAPLGYPFEQLHGRCAALAERICQIFIEKFTNLSSTTVADSLLAKQGVRRGRPTREAKRQAEIHPKRTLEQFWKETPATLPGRFELLADEQPKFLLDNASNLDAFKNLLLGIRLLHYQQPLKGLAIVVGCEDNALHNQDFYKLVRYFFKKTSGNIIFCPVAQDALSPKDGAHLWDVEQITNDVKNKNGKIKARSAKNLTEALEQAKKLVDERNGLIVVTGSRAIIKEYWTITKRSQ